MILSELVVDVSKYQVTIKPDEMPVGMIIVRVAGGLTQDTKFREHADKTLAAGKRLGVYAWDDPNISSARQVDAWLSYLKPYEGLVHSIYPDYEQWWSVWGEWYQAIQGTLNWGLLQKFNKDKLSIHYQMTSSYLKLVWKGKQAPYTSKGFVDEYAPRMNDWLGEYPNWIAQYGYHPSKRIEVSWDELIRDWMPKYTVSAPVGTRQLVGHQFTGDRLLLPGMYDYYGRRSPADVSVFDASWIHDDLPQPNIPDENVESPPPPVEVVKPVFSGVVQIPLLNVRAEPNVNSRDIGDLYAGDHVDVYEVAVREEWYRTDAGWVAGKYNGKEFVTVKTE